MAMLIESAAAPGQPADSSVIAQAALVLEKCKEQGMLLACAESLTGGKLADAFVSVPGASAVFLGSAVTYHLGAKHHLLGVNQQLLDAQGAVDPGVATQMAEGTARIYGESVSNDRVLGISTTGVAGPDSDGFKPVGLVYVGVKAPGAEAQVRELHLGGSRSSIREQSVVAALTFALEVLDR